MTVASIFLCSFGKHVHVQDVLISVYVALAHNQVGSFVCFCTELGSLSFKNCLFFVVMTGLEPLEVGCTTLFVIRYCTVHVFVYNI